MTRSLERTTRAWLAATLLTACWVGTVLADQPAGELPRQADGALPTAATNSGNASAEDAKGTPPHTKDSKTGQPPDEAPQDEMATVPVVKNFIHPPLKCLEKYTNISEYPVMAWCFHGRGSPGYNDEFVEQANLAGFNALIDVQLMVKPASKVEHMMVLVPAFKFDAAKLDNVILNKFGHHSRLIGCIMDDNCRSLRASMPGAKHLAEKYPHLVPFVSENPTPQQQKNTPMRVLGTQNYEMYRGKGVIGYCERLNYDRFIGNQHDMSFWPLYAAPMSASCYRFQVYAPLAYGAQGIICFAYCPGDRWPEWKAPDGKLAQVATPAHLYVRKVGGKHIWGTRSLGVFHSAADKIPRGDGKAESDKMLQSVDKNTLVGFLVPEKDFKDWKDERAPDYAMVVDKRANKGGDAPPRTVSIRFHPLATHVEVLHISAGSDDRGIRIIEPAWDVRLELTGGQGLLLRLNPDGLDGILGDQAGPYLDVVKTVGVLKRKLAEEPPNTTDADGILKQADQKLSRLAVVVQQAEMKKAKLNAAQCRDTYERLKRSVEAVGSELAELRKKAGAEKPADMKASDPAAGGNLPAQPKK